MVWVISEENCVNNLNFLKVKLMLSYFSNKINKHSRIPAMNGFHDTKKVKEKI